jgi:hypothetical protein
VVVLGTQDLLYRYLNLFFSVYASTYCNLKYHLAEKWQARKNVIWYEDTVNYQYKEECLA